MLTAKSKIDFEEIDLALPRRLSILHHIYCKSGSQVPWHDHVRSLLYDGYKTKRADPKWALDISNSPSFADTSVEAMQYRTRLVKFFEETNPVLTSLVRLCSNNNTRTASGQLARLIANQRVWAVITYNLDNLLQEFDTIQHYPYIIFRTVERASKEGRPGSINVYHLHGFMNVVAGLSKDEAPDRLVLTEQEYHDWTDDPLIFGTSAALQALRDFTCVFVGCSMDDELMRRALRRWFRERLDAISVEHNDQDPASDLMDKDKVKRLRRHFVVKPIPSSDNGKEIVDTDFRLSGVWPLWVEDFDADLPRRLDALADYLRFNPPETRTSKHRK